MIVSNSSKPDSNAKAASKVQSAKIKRQEEVLNDQSSDTPQLRPQKLDEYIGQEKMVRQIQLIINSAKIRNTLPEHMLFYGQPGLGKTTIASLLSKELGAHFKVLAAPGLQKTGDLVSLLINLEPKTVLFIDEIHRLKIPLEETLYSAMEDHKVDLLMGKGHGANIARFDLNEFMLIGATTQLGKLSKPLKDRFPSIFQLEPYTETEILQLIDRSSSILGLRISDEAKVFICRRSRGVPRIANNILKRLRDFQIVHKVDEVNLIQTEDFLHELGIYDKGLTRSELNYMRALLRGSVGLKTLGGMLQEEVETLELVTEPYLIHLGYLDKSSGGRSLTPKGREFILQFDQHLPEAVL